MFEDLLQNAEGMQEQMMAELKTIHLSEAMEGVSIQGNASGEITNISIEDILMQADNKEKLEDIFIILFNKFTVAAGQKAQEKNQEMLQKMLPGGFGNLLG